MKLSLMLAALALVATAALAQVFDARDQFPGDAPRSRPQLMAVISRRVVAFNKSWQPFFQRFENCTGSGCQGPARFDMTDYVHACESAKTLFPMLKGNCRDPKKLDQLLTQ